MEIQTVIKKISEHKQAEAMFKNRVVIPFFIGKGYKIHRLRGIESEIRRRPDVIVERDSNLCIIEIKLSAHTQQLSIVIGQIMLQKFIFRGYKDISYIIIFPKDQFEEVHEKLPIFLLSEFNIEILFL